MGEEEPSPSGSEEEWDQLEDEEDEDDFEDDESFLDLHLLVSNAILLLRADGVLSVRLGGRKT